MNSKDKRLLKSKQKAIAVSRGTPSNKEGRDGDFTVRDISGRGLFLYFKHHSKWYCTRLSKFKPKAPEGKESVIVPKGKTPRRIGEMVLDTNNNFKVAKSLGSAGVAQSSEKQMVTMDSTNRLDINEIQALRTSTTSMTDDNGGTSDLKVINTTGHSHMHIQTQVNDHDPYILFSYLTAGESVDLKQWSMGMDNSDSDTFKMHYKASGTAPLVPSSSATGGSADSVFELDTDGNLQLGNFDNAGTDTDKFLVTTSNSDGTIKYRTGAEVLSDIDGSGAITALNNATENELVTVGATTTELDAEANLTFDGNILKVTNTNVLQSQAQFRYDAGNYFSINCLNGGHTTLKAVGDITIEATSNCINFHDGTNIFGEINMSTASTLKLLGVSNYDVKVISQGTGDVYLESNDDIVLDAGDTIHLDSGDGTFTMKQAGTEFSVANSAYAGMILGYRMIGEDASRETYTLTTSFVVPNDDLTVRFIAPPSGAVEIMIQIKIDAQGSNDTSVGLSSANATSGYSTIGATYEQVIGQPDETDNGVTQHYWVVTGLTAGDTYNYWVGFKKRVAGVGNGYLNWGGGSGEHCDFIMKVTALPTAVSDFAEYD